MYLTDMYASRLYVYRFDGEISSLCNLQPGTGDWPAGQPATVRWLWRDLNGDGSIQSNEYQNLGDGESAGLGRLIAKVMFGWHLRMVRYDVIAFKDWIANGSPVYTGSASEEISMPAEFAQIERISISQIRMSCT